MTGLRSLGAAVGIISLVAAFSPTASATASARVCTDDTYERAILSQPGQPASDRVMALIEGNLPLYAIDIALDDSLQTEVTTQQMEIMRSVARELGLAADEPMPTAAD
ncbi:MAG: hypothetical protein Q8S29_02920 [Phreatobacter sp.]|nr:hypothetical protein [Phreatobacter sp.]